MRVFLKKIILLTALLQIFPLFSPPLHARGGRQSAMPRYYKQDTYQKAANYFKEGKDAQAKNLLKEAITSFKDATIMEKTTADAYFEIGNCYHTLGNKSNAQAFYKRYLNYLPFSLYPRKQVEMLYSEGFIDAGTYPEIMNQVDQLEKDPEHYFNQGKFFRALKQYDTAIERLKHLRSLQKNHFKALQYLGKTYFEKNDYKQALTYLKRVTLYPEDCDAKDMYYLGECYRAFKQYDLALRAYSQAQKKDPKDGSPGIGKALSYLAQKQLVPAMNTLKENISKHPQYPISYYLLGSIYQTEFDNKKKALSMYKKFLSTFPKRFSKGNHLVSEAQGKIKELEKELE